MMPTSERYEREAERIKAKVRAAREHEHTTRTSTGQIVWSTRDECTKCGTGRAWQ